MNYNGSLSTITLGLLVVIFGSILRRSADDRLRFWFIGWVMILVHFLVQWIGIAHVSAEIDEAASIDALVLAATAFLVASSSACEQRGKTFLVAASVGLPACSICTLVVLGHDSPWLLTGVSLVAAPGIVYNYLPTGGKRHYVGAKAFPLALAVVVFLYFVWSGAAPLSVALILTGLYAFNALIFYLHFRRLSTGVCTTVVGFLSWGAVWPVAGWFQVTAPSFDPPAVLWNVPKLFVAIGMILTLLEEETRAASREAARNRDLYDRSQCALFRSTLDGRLLDCNDMLVRLSGYGPREKMLGLSVLDGYADPEDRRRWMEEILASGSIDNVEIKLVSRSGQVRVGLLSAKLRRDEDLSPLDIEGVLLDITDRRNAEQALRESERRFRRMFEDAWFGMVLVNPADLRILSANPAISAMLGRTPEQLAGMRIMDLMHPEDRERRLRALSQPVIPSPKHTQTECRYVRPDGSILWGRVSVSRIHNEAGDEIVRLSTLEDITERKLVQAQIAASEIRYRLLFENNPHPMWTYDPETLRFTSINDAALALYGYSRSELLSMKITGIRPEGDDTLLLQELHGSGDKSSLAQHRRKDGSIFWAEVTGHEIALDGVPARLALAQDVTERVRLHEELTRMAQHDALTGLPNRALLEDRATQAFVRARRHGERAAVLVIDLDRFKHVNDTHGHDFGDRFLQIVSERLRSSIRSSDTLARVGGDEFVAILEELSFPEQAIQITSGLLDSLGEKIQVGSTEIQASASIGISIFPEDGECFEELRVHADQALYHAKEKGRQQYCRFNPAMATHAQNAIEIEACLRDALAGDGLELHYQPICLGNGTVSKIEALLRLRHPDLGLLPPGRFMTVAEDTGLIVPMGVWVLREACRQVSEWKGAGMQVVPIAVNVSALQFARADFADAVQIVLAETGVAPALLELELTESLVMANVEDSANQLRRLKQIGVRIAVDDFGTGYSSLSYLHQLPLDTLKIDRSFVGRLTEQEGTHSIVQAIVELGHSLGLKVVAEGVETADQLRILSRLGCDLMQGYLFARPKIAAETALLLQVVAS